MAKNVITVVVVVSNIATVFIKVPTFTDAVTTDVAAVPAVEVVL